MCISGREASRHRGIARRIGRLRAVYAHQPEVPASAGGKGEGTMDDMNGIEIRVGDMLFNPHDRDRYHDVLGDSDGNLFLGDFFSPLEKYSPEKFWSVASSKGEL